MSAWYVDTGLVTAGYGLLTGALVPRLIARIPEPSPLPDGAEGLGEEGDLGTGAAPAKERYAAIAARPGLRSRTALATGVVAGLVGARLGWDPALIFLLYLAPVGVALAVVDWRTRLLPTWLVGPSYLVVGVLAALAAWLAGDPGAMAGAAWGWLAAGGTFFLLWFVYPRGMGYGDVRLSGVLGIALGWLGWAELLTGVYAGFLLGGVGGLLLARLQVVDRRAYPFGPFMLAGALLGVLVGPAVAAWYL